MSEAFVAKTIKTLHHFPHHGYVVCQIFDNVQLFSGCSKSLKKNKILATTLMRKTKYKLYVNFPPDQCRGVDVDVMTCWLHKKS